MWNCLDWFKDESADERGNIHKLITSSGPAVLCLNVMGDANLGSMIRTACMFGVSAFYIAGRKRWDRRWSVGAHHYMDVKFAPDIYDVTVNTHHSIECECGKCKVIQVERLIEFLKFGGFTPCFVEQGGVDARDPVWKRTVERPIFIYGNENAGIPMAVIRAVRAAIPATIVLTIPQMGIMRSHNVASACSLVLWEYVRSTAT
jgi:tRNA G18 (ribose-2'-O)-methylase SpoU